MTDASGKAPFPVNKCQTNQCGSEDEWVELEGDAIDGKFKITTYLTLVEKLHLYGSKDDPIGNWLKGGLLVFNGANYETSYYYHGGSFPLQQTGSYRIVAEDFLNPRMIRGLPYKWGILGQGTGFLDCTPGYPGCNLTDSYTGYVDSNTESNFIGATLQRHHCAGTANGGCATAGETGAMKPSTIDEQLDILRTNINWTPKSAKICIEEWGAKKLTINDTGKGLGKHHLDVYVGLETVKWERGEIVVPVNRSKIYKYVGEK